jgi:negative regulator of flagellin synthesis FlgM
MTVERIGPLDLTSNIKKAERPSRTHRKSDLDSINVSEEAKSKAEVLKATEIARKASEIRTDRIEEVKRKLQDPSYPSRQVIETAADNILKSFGV